MTYWKLITAVLDRREKARFGWILALMLVYSLFESFGLALIVPYVGVLSNQEAAVQWVNTYSGWDLTALEIVICLTVLFFIAIAVKSLLQVLVNWETARFPYEFYHCKAKKLFDLYLSQSYQTFLKGNTGIYIKNCTNTIDQCSNALVQYLKYLSSALVTCFLVVLILFEYPLLSVGIVVLFSLVGIAMHRLVKDPQRWAGQEKESVVPVLYQTISDALLTFKELKIYQKKDYFIGVFQRYVQRLAKAHEVCVYYPTLPVVWIEYIALTVLLGIVVAYMALGRPVVDLLAPMLFFGAVGRRLLPSINAVVAQRIQMQAFIPALECLDHELHVVPTESHGERVNIPFEHSLAFHHVSFSYDRDNPVLQDVTFTISKCHSVAFVGPSGGGKSTLVDLIVSLLSPSTGHFAIDGNHVDSLIGIRHVIGYVPQDVALIDGTIAENIAFGEDIIDIARLEKAITMAHLDDFITSLPIGVDTHVGERGIKLSGGQKQRVGIARALYREPEILIFDEATSSLDTISEGIISEAIREMAGKKTIIAIAHRLSTVETFDVIHVLEAGNIIASGSHRELLQSCPLYQQLAAEVPLFCESR